MQYRCYFKGFYFLFLFLIVVILISACSKNFKSSKQNSDKPIEKKEPIELNWIGHWQNEGKKGDLVREIARKFEFENPDIKVNLKFPQDIFKDSINFNEPIYNAHLVKSQKSDWDIIRIDDMADCLAVYLNDKEWASKYLVDLSSYPEIKNNHFSDLLERYDFKSKWNNILPGVALDGSNAVLWYNQALAKKLVSRLNSST